MTEKTDEVGAWLAAQAERVVTTALAHVFLTPQAAFKRKREVNFGYVDFSTPEKRLWALQRELGFNRPAAPDIYRAIRRITRKADGGLEFDGAGEALDWVLEMRRFRDEAVLAANPEALDANMAEALGRAIAEVQAAAPLRTTSGLSFTLPSNAQLLQELAPSPTLSRRPRPSSSAWARCWRRARRWASHAVATGICTLATSWWIRAGRCCSTASSSTTSFPTSTFFMISPSC